MLAILSRFHHSVPFFIASSGFDDAIRTPLAIGLVLFGLVDTSILCGPFGLVAGTHGENGRSSSASE
jgi:hypothetical protein